MYDSLPVLLYHREKEKEKEKRTSDRLQVNSTKREEIDG